MMTNLPALSLELQHLSLSLALDLDLNLARTGPHSDAMASKNTQTTPKATQPVSLVRL